LDRPPHGEEALSVRLTRKYAEIIDGVDLTDAQVGDRLNLSQHDAEMLIAEGWAERLPRRTAAHPPQLAHAADRSTNGRPKRPESKSPKPRRKSTTRR
jgi:hypothetical protein